MNDQERDAFLAYATLPCHQRKVDQSLQIIREALTIAPAYVALSWGKDSISMLHLCQQVKSDIQVISFGHEERELISNYAEVEQRYCDRFSPNLATIEMTGDHVPNKVLKAKLWESYPVAIVGLRKEESKGRAKSLKSHGQIYQYKEKGWRVCPLAWWNWRDVWAYICRYDLPYLNIYNDQEISNGRTTDHVSKSTHLNYQQVRLNSFKILAPSYYQYLRQNYSEMFYAD